MVSVSASESGERSLEQIRLILGRSQPLLLMLFELQEGDMHVRKIPEDKRIRPRELDEKD